MRKTLSLMAFLFVVLLVSAQEENNNPVEDPTGNEMASGHGTDISDLAKTTENGKEKGKMISSAARAKALMHANAKASFLRTEMPGNAAEQSTGKPEELPMINDKPEMLPPVSPPTQGKPDITPVSKPIGVPVGAKPTGLPGGN